MVFREEGIEKTMKSPLTYVANITDFYGSMPFIRTWFPQCVPESRICDRELVPKDIVVGHIATLASGESDWLYVKTLFVMTIQFYLPRLSAYVAT